MKFETYLRNERISEWRHSYANYGQLKAKIKDVEVAIREKRRRGEDIAGPLDNWISAMLEQGGISIIPAVESHLEDNLDEPRPDETESLLAPPGASRPSLNRRSRNDPSKALQRKASFRDAIRTLTSVLEPAPQRIDYGAMPLSVILMVRGIHAEVEFFHYLDRQLSKVNTCVPGIDGGVNQPVFPP
ncbi:hypothetical protein DFJ74DRAFT_688775 [Hyaloraphidium curvatum]|nr:hypothetical protein DFJ74DRAFT_688775 [Hyaloraphidium curvatum]